MRDNLNFHISFITLRFVSVSPYLPFAPRGDPVNLKCSLPVFPWKLFRDKRMHDMFLVSDPMVSLCNVFPACGQKAQLENI